MKMKEMDGCDGISGDDGMDMGDAGDTGDGTDTDAGVKGGKTCDNTRDRAVFTHE